MGKSEGIPSGPVEVNLGEEVANMKPKWSPLASEEGYAADVAPTSKPASDPLIAALEGHSNDAPMATLETPPQMDGYLKKKPKNFLSGWQIRYFQIRDGTFRWWNSIEDAKAGIDAKCCLSLVGMRLGADGKRSVFSIQTSSSHGMVYNFDCASGANQKPQSQWLTSLEQHHRFAEINHKFDQAELRFQVRVRKTADNRTLGIFVDVANRVHMLVSKVEGGIVGVWNEAHADTQIKVGDIVVAVNGSYGDAIELTQICKNEDVLDMEVVRGLPPK